MSLEIFNQLVNALYHARIGCKLTLDVDGHYHIEVGMGQSQRTHDIAEKCALDLGIESQNVSTCGEAYIPCIVKTQIVSGGPKSNNEDPRHLRHLPKQIRKFYR